MTLQVGTDVQYTADGTTYQSATVVGGIVPPNPDTRTPASADLTVFATSSATLTFHASVPNGTGANSFQFLAP